MGIDPQIPHEILKHGINSWGHLIGGLLLKLPMKSEIAERFLWDTKDYYYWGVALQVPYEILIFVDISYGDLMGGSLRKFLINS